jgi:hypothetical protein
MPTTEKKGNTSVTCWLQQDGNITLRYYQSFYGVDRLFITCSVPKVLRGHNYWYIDTDEVPAFVTKVEAVLRKHIQSPANIDLMAFQLSRADVFYMHAVPPELKELYLDSFGKMDAGRFEKFRIKNTRYLSCTPFPADKNRSGSKARSQSVGFKMYDKDKEVFDRYYPQGVDEDFISNSSIECCPANYIRLEVAMRRSKLRREFGNSVTVGDFMYNLPKQAELLDCYFKQFGMYDRVLSIPNFHKAAAEMSKTDKMYRNLLETARLIRKDRNPAVSDESLRYMCKLLRANGVSIITTKGHDLIPIDHDTLFAHNAVFEMTPELGK